MVLNWFTNFGRYLTMIRITDYLDILIMAAVIYKVLSLGKNSRATSLFKGLGVFLLALWASKLLRLHGISYIMGLLVNWGVLALIILFQP